MDETHDTAADPFEDGPITPERLAGFFAVVDVVIFTIVAHLIAERPAVGALAGLFVGAGVFLFLPIIVQTGEDGDLEQLEPDDPGHPLRSFNRVAAGFALSSGGIVVLVPLFTDLNPFLGVPAGLAVSVALYVPLAWALPNAQV